MRSFRQQIIQPATTANSEFRSNINEMLTTASRIFSGIRDTVSRVMGVVLTNIRERLRAMTRIWKANLSGPDGILANARTAFNSLWNNVIKPVINLIQKRWEMYGDDLIRIFDGVLGVYTAEDLDIPGSIGTAWELETLREPPHPVLVEERVRYQGDAIAMVVAEERYQAHDAAEAVDVDYERLDAVTDPEAALDEDAPVLHEDEGTNTAFEWDIGDAEATEE
jgi:hypothetical protein